MSCNDNWFGDDKIKHMNCAFLLSIICPILGIGFSIGKEILDERTSENHWCWKDLAADLVGILAGSCIFIAMWIL